MPQLHELSGLEQAMRRHTNWILAVLCLIAAMMPFPSHAQTLDEAVNAQLGFVSIECEGLLEGNPANVMYLSGELLVICTRGVPSGGPGPSNSTGGGAATPAVVPAIVEERLREEIHEVGRGFFFTAEYEQLDREVTTFEDGYDSNVARLIIGADRQIGKRWIAGVTAEVSRQEGDFLGGGQFGNNFYGIVGFGSFVSGNRVFVDVYGGYAAQSLERERVATFVQLNSQGQFSFGRIGLPYASFGADTYTAGLVFGYDGAIDNVRFGPRIGADWVQIDYDRYSETEMMDSGLALSFHDDEVTSLLSTVGVEGSVAISMDFGVLVFQQSFSWRHEFANKQRDVEVSFVEDSRPKRFTYKTEPPDTDFYDFNVGLVFALNNDVQVMVEYSTLVSHDFFESDTISAGFRKEF
jgi:uncharacterized protein YhjY with autotransporter beta-barrel domain